MKRQEYTLSNGLRVITIDTKSYPTFTCALLVRAGSRDESAMNNGVAHFFEHMVFKGSKKHPSPSEISTLLDTMGGEHNAFTAQDHTGYWIRSTNEHFAQSLNILSDMILNPLVDADELEREKGAIIEEINMYEDNPMWKVSDIFDEHMYRGTPLGRPIAGTKATVSNMSRSDILNYLEALYQPENAVLVIAGGLESIAKTMKDIISMAFEGWKSGGVLNKRKGIAVSGAAGVNVFTRTSEQIHLQIGYPALSYTDERRFALSVMTSILGGGMSSRLFRLLREKNGLCYYISSGRESYEDVGHMATSMGVSTDDNKLKQALQLTLAEHARIAQEMVSDEELGRAKSMLKGHLLLSMESSENVAEYFAKQALFNDSLLTIEEVGQKIDMVTKKDVLQIAAEILTPSRVQICAVGPVDEAVIQSFI